jgi:AcrR family transcriptional regulator
VTNRRPRSRRGEGERLREEILEAAERLLIETADAEAVSIRAVADAVGVSPPSIYLHFADKNRLLFEVCQIQFDELDRYIREAGTDLDDPVDVLRLQGRAYLRFGLDNPEHYRLLFMGRSDLPPPDGDVEAFLKLSCFGRVVETTRACIDRGRFEQDDPFTVAFAMWTMVHGLTSLLISRPTLPWPLADPEDVFDRFFELFLAGLLTH